MQESNVDGERSVGACVPRWFSNREATVVVVAVLYSLPACRFTTSELRNPHISGGAAPERDALGCVVLCVGVRVLVLGALLCVGGVPSQSTAGED